jgi:hypothetical protein
MTHNRQMALVAFLQARGTNTTQMFSNSIVSNK